MKTKETDWPHITVSFEEAVFTVFFNHDEKKWERVYRWDSLRKVCFKAWDYGAPFFCYLYFKDNADEIIIPVEGENGGPEFWIELKARGLFDPEKEKYPSTGWSAFNCHDVE